MTGNTVDSPAGHGIQAEYCSGLVIAANYVLGPDGHGIYLGGLNSLIGHSNVVTGNAIDSPSHLTTGAFDGIRIEDRSCAVCNNNIRIPTSGAVPAYAVREGASANYNRVGNNTVTASPDGGAPGTAYWLKVGANSDFTGNIPAAV